MVTAMMNAAQCRAKAEAALKACDTATSENEKASWTRVAKQWAGLAVSAEAQQALQQALVMRDNG